MKGERNHLVDQVHAERAAEEAAAEARKNLPPVERVRAAQEHLKELKEIREAKIKIEAKMELLGRAFRDMGIATALAGLWRQYLKGCRRHVFQVRRVAVCVVMMLDLKIRINW